MCVREREFLVGISLYVWCMNRTKGAKATVLYSGECVIPWLGCEGFATLLFDVASKGGVSYLATTPAKDAIS